MRSISRLELVEILRSIFIIGVSIVLSFYGMYYILSFKRKNEGQEIGAALKPIFTKDVMEITMQCQQYTMKLLELNVVI